MLWFVVAQFEVSDLESWGHKRGEWIIQCTHHSKMGLAIPS
jgi:hypothetical protein